MTTYNGWDDLLVQSEVLTYLTARCAATCSRLEMNDETRGCSRLFGQLYEQALRQVDLRQYRECARLADRPPSMLRVLRPKGKRSLQFEMLMKHGLVSKMPKLSGVIIHLDDVPSIKVGAA